MAKNAYYRYIEEIWEVNYEISLQIPVFKCQWVIKMRRLEKVASRVCSGQSDHD
jgi:hypothetical protein